MSRRQVFGCARRVHPGGRGPPKQLSSGSGLQPQAEDQRTLV